MSSKPGVQRRKSRAGCWTRPSYIPVLATELYNRISFKNVATTGSLFEQPNETQAVKTAQQNVRDLMNELVEIVNGENAA